LEQLSPLFEADYLLPRTLISVMSFRHILHLVDSKTFAPYVLIANVFFFVKNKIAYTGFEVIKLLLVVTAVINQSENV